MEKNPEKSLTMGRKADYLKERDNPKKGKTYKT